MKFIPTLALSAVALAALIPFEAWADRRASEEALVFRRLKGGVCTVFGDDGHGSGFLVDSLGIVLTNDHVVGGSRRIRVKFDDSTRVEAIFMASDDKKDVAAIRVNPSVVAGYPVLKLATPSDSMVFEGERALAIGSPLNQEKILTTGVVSKVEPTAIISDVNINHGNSGGPLVNLDGEVIAINTFGDFTDQGGPGISGSVKVSEVFSVLGLARAKLDSIPIPNPRRLPIASRVPFPVDSLRAVAETEKFNHRPYEVSELASTGKFQVVVVTPVYDAWRNWRADAMLAKNVKKREQKGGTEVSKTYNPMRQMRDWMRYAGDTYAPVVTIQLSPKVGQTMGSLFSNVLGSAAAGLGGTAYHGSYHYEYKADFLKIEVLRDTILIEDLNVFRAMIPSVYATADWNASYSMSDEARTGIFQCDPSTFAPSKSAAGDSHEVAEQPATRQHNASNGVATTPEQFPTIHIRVWSVERPDRPYEFDLPEATVKRVWDDFAAWRAAVAGH